MSKNESYDISLQKDTPLTKETELIEVDTKNLKKGISGYSELINENEMSISSESLKNENKNNKNNKNNDNKTDDKITHEIFFQEEIKYRKGNLYTFFYDINGVPKIVIGPDCKYNF